METSTDMFRNVYAEELYAGELIVETVAPIAAGIKVQAALGNLPSDLIAGHEADGMTILWRHDDYVFMARKQANDDGS